jgi:hypothetical protein
MNTQTLQDIDIESIDPNPANPRQDIGDVSELAASIAEQGVQQNLVVFSQVGFLWLVTYFFRVSAWSVLLVIGCGFPCRT